MPSWLIILFKFSVSLLIFSVLVPSTIERRILKSPTTVMAFSISFVIPSTSVSYSLKFSYYVYKYLALLCSLDELTYLSLWNDFLYTRKHSLFQNLRWYWYYQFPLSFDWCYHGISFIILKLGTLSVFLYLKGILGFFFWQHLVSFLFIQLKNVFRPLTYFVFLNMV